MRHLSVLEEAGLIDTFKEGRVRICAIVPGALEPARTWLDEQRATEGTHEMKSNLAIRTERVPRPIAQSALRRWR